MKLKDIHNNLPEDIDLKKFHSDKLIHAQILDTQRNTSEISEVLKKNIDASWNKNIKLKYKNSSISDSLQKSPKKYNDIFLVDPHKINSSWVHQSKIEEDTNKPTSKTESQSFKKEKLLNNLIENLLQIHNMD